MAEAQSSVDKHFSFHGGMPGDKADFIQTQLPGKYHPGNPYLSSRFHSGEIVNAHLSARVQRQIRKRPADRLSKAEILNYFDHRRTNAVLEGMNSIIQSAKRQARGFSNLEYFKTVIYLKLGKLHFPQLPACATH